MTTNTTAPSGSASAGETWPWVSSTLPTPPEAGNGLSPAAVETGRQRAQDPNYGQWLGHVKSAAACRHPIRLAGQIHVNGPDGQRMATYDTADMPDGVIYTPCGNRRASVCPSCAETYRRDTYHLIAAGLRGERWGLPPLDEHIALFVTATAPSFGPVHRRVVKTHAADCRTKHGCTCRPQVCRPFGNTCPHGIPLVCRDRHHADDTRIGTALCLDCYDHHAQVIWNHEAPELWRRTMQEADREIRRLGRRHGVDLRRRYVKVYEFQVRGVVHYHALIRLDGQHPDCPGTIVPPPVTVSRKAFAQAVEAAFLKTAFTSAPHPANGNRGWLIAWGDKGLDLAHVNAPGGEINLAKVTGYLAKYTTKATEVTGLNLRRVDDLTIAIHGDYATHTGRLLRACWELGQHPHWWRLRRYAHQYGYGGHITTKSRGFSVTFGFIRNNRAIWRRTEGHPHLWDDEQAARIINELGYHATGWITLGDALLANTAADQARRRTQAARDAHDDELIAARTPGRAVAA